MSTREVALRQDSIERKCEGPGSVAHRDKEMAVV